MSNEHKALFDTMDPMYERNIDGRVIVAATHIPYQTGILGRVVKTLLDFLRKLARVEIVRPLSDYANYQTDLESELHLADRLIKAGVFEHLTDQESTATTYPDEPRMYRFATNISAGADYFDKKKALLPALYEGIERSIWYKATDYFQEPKTCTLKEAKKTSHILHPDLLAGFSKEQKEHKPFLYTEDSTFLWITGTNVLTNHAVRVPAQLVSAHWFKEVTQTRKEPTLRDSTTNGLAAGSTTHDATISGFTELIERDAFMITYLNQLTPQKIDHKALISADARFEHVLAQFKRYHLEVHFPLLITDMCIPVVCCVLIDRTGFGPAVTLGAAAAFSVVDAAYKSVCEAHLSRLSIRSYYETVKFPQSKTYFTQNDRLAWWAQNEQLPKIEFLISGAHTDELWSVYEQENIPPSTPYKMEYLKQLFQETETTPIAINMRNSTKNPTLVPIVYTIVPELQPLHLYEKNFHRSGNRLRTVPKSQGLAPRSEAYHEPHPFP